MSVPRYFAEEYALQRSNGSSQSSNGSSSSSSSGRGMVETTTIPPATEWTNRLSEGEDISVPFVGTLRPVQQQAIDAYRAELAKRGGSGGGLIDIECGGGKTGAAIYAAVEVVRKKTLIIVHKEFLLNQWVERIQQFAPSAKVGRLQGDIVDIDGKDIVICMLQSLSKQGKYSTSMFRSFGLTIVDEVHHIAAEVFSQALFTVVTKNTLGLSATMDRKDGTSHVFKWFLGPVVYTSPRSSEHSVLVRRVYYNTNDAEFNTVVRNYRDEVQFSTMISKLCAYAHRTEFILNTLVQLIRDHERTIQGGSCSGTTTNKDHWRQVMVIAQNRNVLNFMHKWLKHNHPEISVGFYVGGMKESDLKQTETCQVVLATYAMAAEALDIPTLSVLFMVTPKTDIVQSIGRILRVKRTGLMRPMVYDFIDVHQPFRRQAMVRNTYYRKQGYHVETFLPKVEGVITGETHCYPTDDLDDGDGADDWDKNDHELTGTNSVPVEAPKCLISIKPMPKTS